MKKNKSSCLFFLFLFISQATFCQQSINASSTSAKINDLVFDYSIGEMTMVNTGRNTNIVVTQGFLQPINQNIEATAALSETQSQPVSKKLLANSKMKVYPNPTENIINIESVEVSTTTIRYQLFDVTGKVIINESVIWQAGPNKFSLDLKDNAAGSYYLLIRKPNEKGNLENISYKIQKTN